MSAPGAGSRPPAARPGDAARVGRAARRQAILELVASRTIGSQEELAGLLRERGFAVTQATVSRDIADVGLVKAPRDDGHAYVTPGALAGASTAPPSARGASSGSGRAPADPGEARLRRVLADFPVAIARSGLTLVLVCHPGAASAIAQAIDESPLDEQIGTLAGDDTLLVLFADGPALERWQARFGAIAGQAATARAATDVTRMYT